ncbi:MAG: hypothetical protein ACI9DC_001286 [Gammaproteobacteria bacterium]|jgi:hypothetical protein
MNSSDIELVRDYTRYNATGMVTGEHVGRHVFRRRAGDTERLNVPLRSRSIVSRHGAGVLQRVVVLLAGAIFALGSWSAFADPPSHSNSSHSNACSNGNAFFCPDPLAVAELSSLTLIGGSVLLIGVLNWCLQSRLSGEMSRNS